MPFAKMNKITYYTYDLTDQITLSEGEVYTVPIMYVKATNESDSFYVGAS